MSGAAERAIDPPEWMDLGGMGEDEAMEVRRDCDLLADVLDLLAEIHAEAEDNYDYATDTGASAWVNLSTAMPEIELMLSRLRREVGETVEITAENFK